MRLRAAWLRRRASSDDGFTLVEMMVALFIVTSSLLALLAGFMSSASSLRGQEARAGAVRVALLHNDTLRNADYAGVVSSTDTNVVFNGRTYKRTTTVLPLTNPDRRQITTVVEWTIGTLARSVTLQTSVSPTSGVATTTPTQAIESVTVSPSSVAVDATGKPASAVTVSVGLKGYNTGETVAISWSDDAGAKSASATSTNGTTWTATIPATSIRKVVATGATFSLDFTAKTTANQTSAAALTLSGPSATTGPALTLSCSVNPTTISVNGSGRNSAAVTTGCTVGGLDTTLEPSPDRVKVEYPGSGGATTSTSLIRGTTNKATWSYTIAAKNGSFAKGTSQAFVFTVTRASGGSATQTVPVTVS